MKNIKKYLFVFFTLMLTILLVSCKKPQPGPVVTFTVTFDSQGGTPVSSQTVESGKTATAPVNPEKDGFTFEYWYLNDDTIEFVFTTPITEDITLNALWNEVVVEPTKTNEEMIQEDIDAISASLILSAHELNMPKVGPVNKSRITWIANHKYVSNTGIVLPLLPGETETNGSIRARFSLNGTVVNHNFEIPLQAPKPVEIATKKSIPFTNLTTEYNVADANIDILYEENGSVPYVKVRDFLTLLTGFIDPKYELTYTVAGDILTVSYDYLDEAENEAFLAGLSDFDGWYHLELIIDTTENTIATPDPGFYWAYVYSTKTNYSRHINYDRENAGKIYEGGSTLVYDLDDYNMDIVMYENDAVLPYFVANQLLAGVSYYNVYYNQDGLYGIYALPKYGSDEYTTIHTSSTNQQPVPADLIVHTFNYLGFAFNEFYGAQEIMGVENYFDMFFQRKDNFLINDPVIFDDELFKFISADIDEPHTSYGYPGYFNKADYRGPRLSSLSQFGPRVLSFYQDGLYAVDDAITAKWGNPDETSWAANSRPKYWFLDTNKTTAVLALDGFDTSNIQESLTYDPTLLHEVIEVEGTTIVPDITGGNKFFYYNNSTQEYKLVEVLVKGLDETALPAYVTSLESLGFVLNETTELYEKTIGDKKYLARVEFDATFNLFSVSVLALDTAQTLENPQDEFAGSISYLVESDSAVYMEMYMELITKESPFVDTVLLDLTFNTGGNVGALYRVLGFVTDQPFSVSSIDADTNSHSRSYVYIDGVPTYSHLRWGLLTSPATFSAANSMATIFQQNNLGLVIGTTSGGGASSITPILLPNGTAFTMSSNSISAYVTGTGTAEDPYVFHSNEMGIEPDVFLAVADIYNAQLILAILASN